MVKNPPANAGDSRHKGSILGLGRSPGVGNGNLLQYSCLKFFRQEKLDREVWWATVNGLTKSQTQLVCVHTHTHTHTTHTWDLSSLNGDQISIRCLTSHILNHWALREVPKLVVLKTLSAYSG